ncbi:MAG: glycosyl hydrolase [Lachnospiraceae bacterium]|nr:glycosyl hydrolase [bacterium]MDY5517891.1 glycosyl hydrolase [Lachnospiraceae bacterium]
MKNKIVVRMLVCLLMSAMLATTVAGGVMMSPVTVMAEETSDWTAEVKETTQVKFGSTEEWDWDNTLRAEFDGNGKKIVKDSTLKFTVIMAQDAYQTMTNETDHIKLQAVFFNEKENWAENAIVKLGWPEYKASDFQVNEDGTYSTAVSMTFDKAVNTFQSVLIQGVGTGFQGKVTISDMEITAPENDTPVLEPTEPRTVADFATSIDGWAGVAGWDYSAGKDTPAKNDGGTPVEAAEVSWDETTQSLKMTLDYSKDIASGWSEAMITGNFNAVDVSNYNIVTFKLRYPSSMETVRTKLFMQSTDSTKILDAEGSFRSKTVEKGDDGWSTVTIRGEFKPQATSVESLTIGIVGPYADLKEVYIDDVTFGQLDASEDYVKITETVQETGDQADISKMAEKVKLVDSQATKETKALAAYLLGLQETNQVLFGHQNSTFRSVRDNGVTSDVKDITGSEAGLFGIDTLALAGSECSSEDPMGASIAASKKAYESGSIITLSCHMPNFTNTKITATNDPEHPYDFSKCDFMESKDLTPCADYILEGGEYNPQFNAYLDIIAAYATALQNENIPILFRPFHENSGGWFWWGTSTSVDSYKAMWRYMVNYLETKGVHNLLYVYSPNGPIESPEDYLSRFPGDEYVDVLGFDYYDDYADVNKYTGDAYLEALGKSCDVVAGLAKEKNKIPAIAETGIRITGAGKDSLMINGNPTMGKNWYNNVINTAAAHDIPYFLLWANFDSANFFIPYKFNDTMGQEMINEFISAYNNDKSIFGNGTNFYGESGAISKEVAPEGYSGSVGGYLIAPKNYAVIKDACELKASVKNASKVTFVIKTSEPDTNPIVLEAAKESENSTVYTAQLTKETLATIKATGTGVISAVAYGADDTTGKKLGSAQFINFNQDTPVMPSHVFDNFEYYYGNDGLFQIKYGSHNSAGGSYSEFKLDAVNKVEGNYGGSFNYTLAYKGSETWTGGLGRTFDNKDFSKYNAISMWVKPDGNGQKMVIQLRDSNGKEYEAHLTEFVKGTKAQYVTIPFTSFIVKGGTDSIAPSDIAGCFFWCNTVPDNISGEKKEENGNYTVTGSIVFDDIKAIKISDADLAKLESGKTFITSDAQLTDISSGTDSGSGDSGSTGSGGSGSTSSGSTGGTVEKPAATKPATSTETTTVTNSSNKEVAVTTTTKKDANGNVTSVTEKSEIKDAAEDTTVLVTVRRDGAGAITSAASSVAQVVKDGNQVALSAAVMEQIKEAAGTADVAVTVSVKDADGNTKYKVKANAKDLVKGKKLAIYRVNTKTGEYEMVNAKTYKVSKEGTVNVSMTEKKVYELVTEAKAKELSNQIKATVKAAKTSLTVKNGKTTKAKLHGGLNMNNVKTITYASTKKSVAKVDKNGKITAKKAGTATIRATVTLKNGTKKTVTMKVKVK